MKSRNTTRQFRAVSHAVFEAMEKRQLFAAITVTSAGDTIDDDGFVTLREAITSANSNSDVNADVTASRNGAYIVGNANGGDSIGFNIPGAGVHTIQPASALPVFSDDITIDGFTQPGATANTLAIGNNAAYQIEISGSLAGSQVRGFDIQNSATIRGMVLNRFKGGEIVMAAGSSGSIIEGNFIGTNVTGTDSAGGEPNNGVSILSSQNNRIGGPDPAARNLISGHEGSGILFIGADAFGNLVSNNYIGVNAAGTNALANGSDGITLTEAAHDNTIGGTNLEDANVISANFESGVGASDGASGNSILGNRIGTNATGTVALANHKDGIFLSETTEFHIASNLVSGNGANGIHLLDSSSNSIGGNAADGDEISGNEKNGVLVDGTSVGNAITGNTIFGNKLLAIDLGNDGSTANDASDADSGANNLQNAPVMNFAQSSQNLTTLQVLLNSTPSTPFRVDFFFSLATDNGPGQRFLGAAVISTDASGDANVSMALNQSLPDGFISATATNLTTKSTSEFAAPLALVAAKGGKVEGKVFNDINGNGTQDGNEPAQADVQVFFDRNDNGIFDGNDTETGTASDGRYSLITTTNETVLLRQTAPAGFVQNTQNPAPFALVGGNAFINANFGNQLAPVVLLKLSVSDVQTNEGNSGTKSFNFTINLDQPSDKPVTVQFAVQENTAKISSDFIPTPLTSLTFAAGQTSKTISVQVVGDTQVEPDETFFLKLLGAANAQIADGSGTGTIKNDDAAAPVSPVSIVKDPCDPTKTSLRIEGTDAIDNVTVSKVGSLQGKAKVTINGKDFGTFSFTGSIQVFAKGASDSVSIDSAITRTAFVFAGEGNDTVNGGGGNDVLVGNAGNDNLKGNAGRDLLFGGDGADKLNGGGDDDLLVAGGTAQDNDVAKVCKLLTEWKRTDKNYGQRVAHIVNGGGLNGTVTLNASNIFSSSGLKDSLTGGTGTDLFFAAIPGDVIVDKVSGEVAVDVG